MSMRYYKEVIIFLSVGFLLFFPLLFLNHDIAMPIYDHMDSNHVWYKLLVEKEQLFASPFEIVSGYNGEQYRFSYPSGFGLQAVLYYLFNDFQAYWLFRILLFVIGFIGMTVLLKQFFPKKSLEITFLSLIWATCYYYVYNGLGVAALPFLALAFLLLYRESNSVTAYFIIILYSISSELVLVSGFAWLVSFLIFLILFLKTKRLSMQMAIGIFLMFVIILLKEWQLILATLFPPEDYVSHRVEFLYDEELGQGIIDPVVLLLKGSSMGVSYWWGLSICFFLGMIWLWVKKEKKGLDFQLGIFAILLALLCYFLSLPTIINLPGKVVPTLKSLNITRFYNLVGFIWILGFGLFMLKNDFRWKYPFYIGCILIHIFVYQYEWRSFIKSQFPTFANSPNPTYRQFYSTAAYSEIISSIPSNYSGYVGHINLPPAISAFNGLKTIDGYLANYDLSHKHKIRTVIAEELDKDHVIKKHFDNWGNKCYLMNHEVHEWIIIFRNVEIKINKELIFDWNYLKHNLNTSYIISTQPLDIPEVEIIKDVLSPESIWHLRLYKIK
jgi:hypothetical protein